MKFRSLLFTTIIGICSHSAAHAQEKDDFNPSGARKGGLAPPTPIDKMIALDSVLGKDGVNWASVWTKYQLDINPNDYSDVDVAIPVLLGMRMSDGVLAIKARDAEKLNEVASDIEKLAKKLKVSDAELARAKQVRLFAGRNEWPRVFLELGYLQHDVLATLKKDANADRRALLIAAGWLQGVNSISNVVNDQYSTEASGLLREPLLIDALLDDLNTLKPDKKQSPQALALVEELTKIRQWVNVPMRAPIPQADVANIAKNSSAACKNLRGLAK
ncbi:MAG: hypothetical protein HC845_05005 [Akkermansiaceae bacterium]|nr:hypothetical protein [Akkermansiaceae bacterium]